MSIIVKESKDVLVKTNFIKWYSDTFTLPITDFLKLDDEYQVGVFLRYIETYDLGIYHDEYNYSIHWVNATLHANWIITHKKLYIRSRFTETKTSVMNNLIYGIIEALSIVVELSMNNDVKPKDIPF